jgi:acyl dehydratase
MIFENPAGAPELACNHCGCRWFDRMTGACYECGEPVPPEDIAAYQRALGAFHAAKGIRPNDESKEAQMTQRWFEDYVPGSVHELGTVSVTESEIIDFARRFDGQPMHTDPDLAARSPFGGVIASGWHTAALMMRLYAVQYLSYPSSIASPGMEELRWPAPVRGGDTLSVRVTVREARASTSKPDRGVVKSLVEVFNQHGETVMTMLATNMILRRPTPARAS